MNQRIQRIARRRRLATGVAALALGWSLLGGAAQAQVATPQPPVPADSAGQPPSGGATTSSTEPQVATAPDESGLGDIVVTAQKRSQSAQAVPAAVVAIDGAQLSSRGVIDARGLSALVPAARFEQVRSQVQVTVRGVGQANTGPNTDPAVATNLNGIYQLNDMTGAAFFDIDRVEVLPGPQGTLYGRNAAGGTVNIFTRRPGRDLAGNANLELGNYNTVNFEAGLDLPLADGLAVRAAGGIQTHKGYLSNGANDRENRAARLTAVYKPDDRLSIVLVGSYTFNGGIGEQGVNKPAVKPSDPYYYPFSTQGHFRRSKVYTVSGEVNYAVSDNVTLTYLGGYDNFHYHQFLDLDAQLTPLTVQTQEIDQRGTFYSHEARLSGDTGPLKWILGAYYYHSDQPYSVIVNVPPVVTILQTPINVSGHGAAAFGQLTYSLTPSLRLTGGLRYSDDAKKGYGEFTTVVAGRVIPAPFTGSTSENRLDWKAGIEADVAADSLAYATVQSGFNQGGFSFAPAIAGGGNEFAPEKLIAYTAGIKNRFADRTIQLNLEAYYYDYKNYQVSARNLTNGLNVIYNAQKAKVYGIQVDTVLLPTPQDRLSATLGLLHAEATRLILPSTVTGQANFSGYELPSSPDVTFTASYEHNFSLANGGMLTPRVSTSYTSARWSAYNHFVGSRLKAFDKTDLQLIYQSPSRRWSIEGFVRNLTDVAVYNSPVAATFPGPAAGFLEPPRTYGGRVSVNF